MAFRIVWSPEAIDDVDALYNYISRDSEYYAKSVVKKLIFRWEIYESGKKYNNNNKLRRSVQFVAQLEQLLISSIGATC